MNGRDETAIPFEGAAAIVFHFSKTFTVQTDTEERKKKESEPRLRWRRDIIALQSAARFLFFFSPSRDSAPDSSLQYSEGSSVSRVSL